MAEVQVNRAKIARMLRLAADAIEAHTAHPRKLRLVERKGLLELTVEVTGTFHDGSGKRPPGLGEIVHE